MSQKKGFLLFFLIIAMIWGERGLSAQAAKCPDIQNGRTDFKESAVSGSVKKYILSWRGTLYSRTIRRLLDKGAKVMSDHGFF